MSNLRAPLHRHAPAASRRRLLAGAAAAALAAPALAAAGIVMPSMTDGPFYPPRRWRAQWGDWDADLTQVEDAGRVATARGEHLALEAQVVDAQGRAVDGAEVEIWQCDTLRHYRHPDVARREGAFDPGFQGFGAARSGPEGAVRFRTIRPVSYPGRTPHIHVKLRHASFGEWTSQLFIAGEPANARDFLWRNVAADGRAALEMRLEPAPAGAPAGLRWLVRHRLVVPT